MSTSTTRSGTTTSYRYSADGQRYWMQSGSTTEHYALDGSTSMGVFTDTGVFKWWNIVADGKVVGRYEPNRKKYYYTDVIGSTRAVVNTSGLVLEAYDYYPFGLTMPARAYGSGTKERFTGQERDGETGMDYFGARYYMPALGRWASVDPKMEKYPGVSPYAYVLNNPVGLTDPDGQEVCCIRVPTFSDATTTYLERRAEFHAQLG